MSPLLLENTTTPAKQGKQVAEGLSSVNASEIWAETTSAVHWSTPRKREELKESFSLFSKLEGDAIVFERDGKTESIRATNGTGTGMKYYGDDRTDCLVITEGSEGFCR